ncbi:outer membrane beta-barrel protein [Chryseosolibacter indicus]|uniref:Outer membrane beta-barrel protein n=1 Tax=Chryseosolibacter indicus TaxID=2782351 RepID=A0ABS5VQT5_9BACT|nr:outer membrane beta-barrel protein [Chryseosolibacter indicus]MBT1703802.1 outer membrane beta-barrel protein [Chryseosolibacter indicus]
MKILACLFSLLCSVGFAQNFSVSGKIQDSSDSSSLIGVSVWLYPAQDTTIRSGVVTDVEGKFLFNNISEGNYVLGISYLGYSSRKVAVNIRGASIDLGNIKLSQGTTTLKSVEIAGNAIQVEQKGDTVQYNANAFKTNRDASAEDLIAKMPGMTSDNSGLKVQGETVQQVLVDGKEFFGDDAALALKNLPAEIIDKIEVFDRMSEQSQFSGFDDGQTRKTVNIVTKKGMNNGQFGRVYAGIGQDGLYSAGGNINAFKGTSRLSLVGLSNNVNQQNFSSEDLLGVMNTSGGGGRGGRGNRGGGQRGGGENNFSVGQQNGISTTHSVGLNYSDEWGKKMKISGSYFFNASENERITDLNRLYITALDSGLVYRESDRSNSKNYNHRFNGRLEYSIDSANSLVITPRLSFQQNDARSLLNGSYSGVQSNFSRMLTNQNNADNSGYNFANNVLFRHRFKKRGRSLSVGINTEINNREGNTSLFSMDDEMEEGETNVRDQQSDNFTDTWSISPNLAFTEPVGKRGQLQLNYSPSYRNSKTDKKTFNYASSTETYTVLDSLLSNTFDNEYITQRGGVSYRYNNKKLNFNTGLNYQQARLISDQSFPYVFSVDRSFSNVLPQFSLNYKFTSTENVRIQYRSSTNAPSVSQLQNVIDNRNPLFLRTGNPDLSQDYSHNVTIRYGNTNPNASSSLLVMVNAGLTQNYITNTSIIAVKDTVVNGITLTRGTQLSFPVNVDGYQNARTMITYGIPLSVIKSNVNFTSGLNYNRIPTLINGAQNLARNYGISQGIIISSNINEKIDFTVGYTANYTIVKNSLQQQSDNNYLNQNLNLRLNWIFWKGFVFSSNLNTIMYNGLSAQFDQSIWYWNAGLGYKFLKDQSLEVKLNAFDILNQNNSISRDITETFIEDRESNVLTRYFLFTVTYRLGNFNSRR